MQRLRLANCAAAAIRGVASAAIGSDDGWNYESVYKKDDCCEDK
jgi:hypothetical protein